MTGGPTGTADYKLYAAAISGNCYKVALYLNCAGLPWEAVPVDILGGETRQSSWQQRVNDMGEVPVLEADGQMLTQSGAILVWLAETTGHFAPASEAERYEALRWILYDNYRFTNAFAAHRFQRSVVREAPHPAVVAYLRGRADGALATVERHLTLRPFILGQRPTIADFSLAGYMFYPPEETGYVLEESHPAIHAWRERIRQLPGWKAPYDLIPGPRVVPRA